MGTYFFAECIDNQLFCALEGQNAVAVGFEQGTSCIRV